MIVVDHSEVIYPHDGAQALDVRSLLIDDEVANEEALAHRLDEAVMALSRAGRCATGRAERARSNSRYFVTAGALQFA